jgi:hypothetical protein
VKNDFIIAPLKTIHVAKQDIIDSMISTLNPQGMTSTWNKAVGPNRLQCKSRVKPPYAWLNEANICWSLSIVWLPAIWEQGWFISMSEDRKITKEQSRASTLHIKFHETGFEINFSTGNAL